MSMPSSVIAPSAVAILSTLLLCSPSASQTATGTNAPLPDITVEAPHHAARPHQGSVRTASTHGGHQGGRAARTATQTAAPAPAAPAPGSVMARIKELERTSNNCNDGCATSFKYGNQPWNGCSGSQGPFVFMGGCRMGRNFKTYEECRETGTFLAARHYEVWVYCSSLLAAGKLSGETIQVADIRPSGRR